MGKQYNKTIKSRRRTNYLKRKKQEAAAKLKTKTRAKGVKKAEAAATA